MTVRTACNRDCPDACSLDVQVEGGRVRRIVGNPEHPLTRGFLCYRTGRFLRRQEDPDRITRPLLRMQGVLTEVSWVEALDRCALEIQRAIDEDGPQAVAHLQSGGSLGILKGMTGRFFRRLGPVTRFGGDICGGAGDAAQELDFGISESSDVFDVRHSRQLVLFGKNLGVSNIHLIPLVKECVRQGMRLFYVGPRAPEAGLPGHQWIRTRPGRDAELALGVARLVLEDLDREGLAPGAGSPVGLHGIEGFRALCRGRSVQGWADEAGVSVAELETLAACYRDGPTATWLGWGLQRRLRGGQTVRAIDALVAVAGQLGVRGGGVSYYYGRKSAFRTELFEEGAEPGRVLQQVRFAAELEAAKPRVRVLYISCMNPVAMLPDSGGVAAALEDLPFVIVADSHPNDTTRRADCVLPIETLLEDEDLVGAFGHHFLTASRPVIERPPEVRSDLEIVQGLSQRLGFGDAFAGSRASWCQKLLRPELVDAGIRFEGLQVGPQRSPIAAGCLFEDGKVPTPSGKVEVLQKIDPPPGAPEGYPLQLFSDAHRKSQSSQWADGEAGLIQALVHPSQAGGIPEGSRVRIRSSHASLEAELRFDPKLSSDMLCLPKGGSFDLGRAANALVAPALTDIGGGAAYLDTWVRIEACSN